MAKQKKHRRDVAVRLDDFVQKSLGSMMSYSETVDAAVVEFDIDERTAQRSIARVRDLWRQASAASVDERRAKFLGELEHAWRQALIAGDYRAVAVMARTRADVEGIRAVKKVEHGGTLNLRPVAAMSPEERRREIAILLAKRQAALGAGAPPAVIDTTATETPAELDQAREVVRAPASKPGRKKRKAQVH